MSREDHHVIPQQRMKVARSCVAIKRKRFEELTEAEARLLDTPLSRILGDRRNIVRISRTLHHRAHNGFERLKPADLPDGIYEFAEEYALEPALEHELRLMGVAV